MSGLDEARQALRARQGPGARHDAPEAPAEALALVRRGTAFFARKLNELADGDLAAPSALKGRSRAHVVADVALQARAICWRIEAAEAAQDPGAAGYLADTDRGATLPPHALRHLFVHSAIHLDVVWRDLPGPLWDAPVIAPDGTTRPMRDLAAERARVIWQAALDLGNGARLRDLPAGVRP